MSDNFEEKRPIVEEGYLDYHIICEEMDELMKSAPPLCEWERKHCSEYGPFGGGSVFTNDTFWQFLIKSGRESTANNYFQDVMKRAEKSTSGPRDERIALYVVSGVMIETDFFHRGRIVEYSGVYYDKFHKYMRSFLNEHKINGDFEFYEGYAEMFENTLLRKWEEKSVEKQSWSFLSCLCSCFF